MHNTTVQEFRCFWSLKVHLKHAFPCFRMHSMKNAKLCSLTICRILHRLARYPAETEGFEPSIPFRGIHTFQACSFNHSDKSPFKGGKNTDLSLYRLNNFCAFAVVVSAISSMLISLISANFCTT